MPGSFVERFRAIVHPLFNGDVTLADGIDEQELDAILDRCGYEAPEVLRDFYIVVGGYQPIMGSQDHFCTPGRSYQIEDKTVFCEENQSVVLWAYACDQGWRADPPVYQGVNNDAIEWYVEAERCSDFLSGMIYWQALNGGLPELRFRSRAGEAVRKRAADWPLVWQDEDTQLFSRGPLVFSLTGREAGIDLQAAGPSQTALAELWKSLGL